MSAPRKLAAILAADVAGYSRLTGIDEEGTLSRLRELRREAIDPAISRHHGRLVKTTGDGMLVEFGSVVDAVRCAISLQRDIAAKNGAMAAEQHILFRIGINLGDVVVEGDDLLGEGVNVAARLEGIAEPGGIVVSDSAYQQVRDRVSAQFADMGEQPLKNIARPVHAYRILAEGVAQKPALPLPDRPSIAVLPFQNMSGDPEQEYFADGIAEEIITALSRFRQLFVIARNSSFTYKGRAVDVKQVARELGVRYVLEGSVRKSANRIRITGQLIDASSGAHLWADRFDGGLEDIFDLQDQVTATVVSAIAPKIEQAEIERTKRKPTDKLDAYDYYLRGVAVATSLAYGVPNEVRAALNQARALFHKAIDLDPEFAAAYGMAAQCYIIENQFLPPVNRAEMLPEVTRLARRAATLGKEDAMVLSHAGQALAYIAGEIEEGAGLLDRALALNPNLALAWNMGGWTKIFLGEHEEAIARMTQAMRLSPFDPLHFLMLCGMALGHLFAGRANEAASWAEKALRERPNTPTAMRIATACFALAGRLEEARRTCERLSEAYPHMRVSQIKHLYPTRRADDLALYEEGLRRAGFPE
ncbi:MAG TPA: adenylate/guanylate cyclase domain-containing protein [Candidatus Cybelea sp.]|nr:adenylate/guanylate cyclase domain-containing protein [Candidatus Cybelea sp.]